MRVHRRTCTLKLDDATNIDRRNLNVGGADAGGNAFDHDQSDNLMRHSLVLSRYNRSLGRTNASIYLELALNVELLGSKSLDGSTPSV